MSKDLDNSLKKIKIASECEQLANGVIVPVSHYLHDDEIQQIKDCFIADGWVSQPILKYVMQTKGNEPIMTGEEWYKKFEQELPAGIAISELALDGNYHMLMRDKVLKAAKRASGVKR